MSSSDSDLTSGFVKEDAVLRENNLSSEDTAGCPRAFDGFVCWDETPRNAVAVQPCPAIVVGFDPQRLAFKRCTENGTWYVRPGDHKSWTDYTTCINMDDLQFRNLINNIYVVGYALSATALIISMMIFLYFRSLRCTRIRIHLQLFLSFSINSILWIVWYETVVNNAAVVRENHVWCQLLHLVIQYFMVASYVWMFCESLHLHIALVVVFMKEGVAMRWFFALGWGLPLLIVAIYAVARYSTHDHTQRCWMDEDDSFWIIAAPVVASLIVSFVFLVNVVRVLVTKLHHAGEAPSALATKKAARAALILIPLFGVHFLLIPIRPAPNTYGEEVYQIFSALLTSLQGVCVAVLFCFTNHEVKHAWRAHLPRFSQSIDGFAMTGVTGESLANTRDVSVPDHSQQRG